MQLFHCETIAQFKIMSWLVEQGVKPYDITYVEKLSSNQVKIGTFNWTYIVLAYEHGAVSTDQTPEAWERFRQYIEKQRVQDELRAQIMSWLVEQGVTSDEIAQITFLSADRVEVTNG